MSERSGQGKPDGVLTLNVDALEPLRSPVMLVALRGWFDVAGVATTALERVVDDAAAVTIGEIDPDPFFDFTVERPTTTLDAGGDRTTAWPVTTARISRHPSHDLVVVTGVEPHLHWRSFAEAIVTTARRLACEAVVTLGAVAEAVPHTRTPPVVGSSTSAELATRLGLSQPTYQGVTGLIGVLLVQLDLIDVPAVSLRVGVPHYLGASSHPQASAALVHHLAHVLGDPLRADFADEIAESDELHAAVVEADAELAQYVAALEREFDRRAEAEIPSPDELGKAFEDFLREHRDDDQSGA